MELIKFKILYYWNSKKIPVNNKTQEAQVNLHLYFNPSFEFKFDLAQDDTNIFNFYIDLFGLFFFQICKNKKTDHAGFFFNIKILGLEFDYNKHDTRHWDWENDTWEVYE
jgi:hypothetical protein